MKALVAGATGFIGAHLVRALVDGGHDVVALIRPDSADLWRLAPVRERVRTLSYAEAGADPGNLEQEAIDVCYNLASFGVNHLQTDPVLLAEGNLALAGSLLGLCRQARIPGFVHVGTGFEYANTGRRISEQDAIVPASRYGAAKAAASRMLLEGPGPGRTGIVVLRPFSVFGPMEGLHRLIPQAMDAVINRRPMDLTPGEQVRDYLYVEDLALAMVRVGQSGLPSGSVFNICGDRAMSIRDFMGALSRLAGADPGLFRFGARAYRPDEMMYFVGDDSRFRAAVDWRPRCDLEHGMLKTYQWYLDHGIPTARG